MKLIHLRVVDRIRNKLQLARTERDRKKALIDRLRSMGFAEVTVDKLSSCLVMNTFEKREELTRLAILLISQQSACAIQTQLLQYNPLKTLAKKMSVENLEALLKFLETNINVESTEEPIEKRVRDYYSTEITKGAVIVAIGVTGIVGTIVYSSIILGVIGVPLAVFGTIYTRNKIIEGDISEELAEERQKTGN